MVWLGSAARFPSAPVVRSMLENVFNRFHEKVYKPNEYTADYCNVVQAACLNVGIEEVGHQADANEANDYFKIRVKELCSGHVRLR